MNFAGVKFTWVIWAGLALAALTLVVGSLGLKLSASRRKPLPVYGQLADFTLTDQDHRPITLANLRGHVWVADIIFTRCAGPCLKMTRQMKELEQGLGRDAKARLVTLTTDPDFDTPAVLRAYAERFSADLSRWMFLTGTKKQIAALAIDSLKLTAIEKSASERQSPDDLFVHSTIFVIVDRQAQLRGVFETTGEGTDPRQVQQQILAAVRELEQEG